MEEIPENPPPQEEEKSFSWGSFFLIVGAFAAYLFVLRFGNGPATDSEYSPYDYSQNSNSYVYGQNPLPQDRISKLLIEELQQSEKEAANSLDAQQAKSPGEIYRMNVGAVVLIATNNSSSAYSDNDSASHFIGSGIVVSSAKYGFCVLTASHVLRSPYYRKGSPLFVYFESAANSQPVKVLKYSPHYDALLLQFADAAFWPVQNAAIGKSALLNTGTELFVIGSGYAGAFLLTKGMVSKRLHKFGMASDKVQGYEWLMKWPTVILADLTIVSGFSGGPIFNKLGQLVGIVVGVVPDTAGNIGVGLPIDDLRKDFGDIF